jgi:hypothetical protein
MREKGYTQINSGYSELHPEWTMRCWAENSGESEFRFHAYDFLMAEQVAYSIMPDKFTLTFLAKSLHLG